MKEFDAFFKRLQRRASRDQAYNPYKDPHLLNNLKHYFEYLYTLEQDHILLVGEAPGYSGCRLTGIPFSSVELIQNSEHELFVNIRDKIILEASATEKTAGMVWAELKDKKITPIFWNAFPFHPYKRGNQSTNRAPTSKEVQEGQWYIKELINIFEPTKIAAIGRKGELALGKIDTGSDVHYIRHPSYGGKSDFIKHIKQVIL